MIEIKGRLILNKIKGLDVEKTLERNTDDVEGICLYIHCVDNMFNIPDRIGSIKDDTLQAHGLDTIYYEEMHGPAIAHYKEAEGYIHPLVKEREIMYRELNRYKDFGLTDEQVNEFISEVFEKDYGLAVNE